MRLQATRMTTETAAALVETGLASIRAATSMHTLPGGLAAGSADARRPQTVSLICHT
jgi:hypothetical protein